jgi:hypothetical protein
MPPAKLVTQRMEPTTNLLLVIGKTSAKNHTECDAAVATEKLMKTVEEAGVDLALCRT